MTVDDIEQQPNILFSRTRVPSKRDIVSMCPSFEKYTACQIYTLFCGSPVPLIMSSTLPSSRNRVKQTCALEASGCNVPGCHNCLSHMRWVYSTSDWKTDFKFQYCIRNPVGAGGPEVPRPGGTVVFPIPMDSARDMHKAFDDILQDADKCSNHAVWCCPCNQDRTAMRPESVRKLDEETPLVCNLCLSDVCNT